MSNIALLADESERVSLNVSEQSQVMLGIESSGVDVSLSVEAGSYDSGLRYYETSNEYGTTITIG